MPLELATFIAGVGAGGAAVVVGLGYGLLRDSQRRAPGDRR